MSDKSKEKSSSESKARPSSESKENSRRGFMKTATLAIGGVMGAITAVPLVRYFLHPVGRRMVSTPSAPIDIAAASDIVAGAAPVRLPIIASGVRDAWNTANDIAVGSCWVSKSEAGEITAYSSVCPHLGCSISFSEKSDDFRCPCHNSSFNKKDGGRNEGPAKRGLDPLEIKVEEGRVKVVYKRYRNDISDREPV
ncbi:MAG: ubiquinol-cytochrome c reductase iron-sulfur subunit [Kofleriaceae bacterium]|nr:ubiquinol-cytochrome c reductase iron-sulfur subunit [Kofleriaceae bacterium]